MSDDPDLQAAEPGFVGTARLAHSALNAPAPPTQAEDNSRRRVERLMQDAALSPKALREAVREQPQRPWWRKLLKKE